MKKSNLTSDGRPQDRLSKYVITITVISGGKYTQLIHSLQPNKEKNIGDLVRQQVAADSLLKSDNGYSV